MFNLILYTPKNEQNVKDAIGRQRCRRIDSLLMFFRKGTNW